MIAQVVRHWLFTTETWIQSQWLHIKFPVKKVALEQDFLLAEVCNSFHQAGCSHILNL
jgi:hypothetical protein